MLKFKHCDICSVTFPERLCNWTSPYSLQVGENSLDLFSYYHVISHYERSALVSPDTSENTEMLGILFLAHEPGTTGGLKLGY